MKNCILFIFVGLAFLQCTDSSKKQQAERTITTERIIDFGELKQAKMSDIITDYSFVKLESSEQAVIGRIYQIEVFREDIYVLDEFNVYVFSKTGQFLRKFENRGNGPGEFISPHSFYIDEDGYIFVLDMTLPRLLKYKTENFSFVEAIAVPVTAPLSFSYIREKDLYVYYHKRQIFGDRETKEIVVADKSGNVKNQFLNASASNMVDFGSSCNMFRSGGSLHIYPQFSNKILTITSDSLACRYQLQFGKYKMVDDELFIKTKGDYDVIMHELYNGNLDCVYFLYVYETEKELLVRYFVNGQMYVGIWDKETSQTYNFKSGAMEDDLGFGGVYPFPRGTYDNQYIGDINPFKIDKSKLKNEALKSLVSGMDEEDNPIIVFYSTKF